MNGCPHNNSGKGVKKYHDNDGNPTWQCEICVQESTVADLTSAPSTEFIQNELLCFLNTSWSGRSSDDIASICHAFYSEEEIKDARRTMFDHYTGDPAVKKVHSDSTQKENYLRDVIYLLNAAKAGELPVFVAVNLHRIPSTVDPQLSTDGADRQSRSPEVNNTGVTAALQALEEKFAELSKYTTSEFSKVHADLNRLCDQRGQRPPPIRAPVNQKPALSKTQTQPQPRPEPNKPNNTSTDKTVPANMTARDQTKKSRDETEPSSPTGSLEPDKPL